MSVQLTRADRRREYYHLLNVVDKNTGGAQLAMASVSSVLQIVAGNGVDDPKQRLRAAVANDDVVVHGGRVVRARTEDLRAALAEEDSRDEPDRAKMKRLAKALAEVDDD